MSDLFDYARAQRQSHNAPLAVRMRPRTLDEFIGQEHIIGPGRLLRRAIEADQLSSIILWGPPGTGKTTLANIIAQHTQRHFSRLNAVTSGVKELRELIAEAQERLGMYGQGTVLFIDEIHRWNKAQQDGLLPFVEDGTVVLIGSTTENPFFSLVNPLLSRSRVFQLLPLTEAHVIAVLQQALDDHERGLGKRQIVLTDEAAAHLANVAGGDARSALNALELAAQTTPPAEDGTILIDLNVAQESIQRRAVRYDKGDDEHYDTISAFIKSVRGSDPDAALYWMAKMLHAGEDPRFLLRRMFILASEDIGLADPNALVIVSAAASAFEWVGMPEGHYFLSHACLYLATAPKSNSAGAIWKALDHIDKQGPGPVPPYLRDKSPNLYGAALANYQQAMQAAVGEMGEYKYPHDYPGGWVEQQYLPLGMEPPGWYQPKEIGYEKTVRERFAKLGKIGKK
ncbi:MAG: replication-associated recombination protein A [Chloroflexi bacterium]|nr:replication-associated recombination protein A [Chloroflexota bacterium]